MQNPIKTNQQPTTLPTTIGAGDLTLCKGACYQADNLGSIPEVHVVEGGDMFAPPTAPNKCMQNKSS